MAIHWKPDTCGCDLEFKADTTNQPQYLKEVLARCPDHAGLATDVDVATAVLDENRLRMSVLRAAEMLATDALPVRYDQYMEQHLESVRAFEATFNSKRRLTVTWKSAYLRRPFTSEELAAIEDMVALEFGPGKFTTRIG